MFLSDDAIEAALSQTCPCCPAAQGEECVHPTTGQPWLELKGYPVHLKRCDP